ncbi:MAG: beta-ketoacyl synthase chain length factor [Steroidobacteraceae bacterium]
MAAGSNEPRFAVENWAALASGLSTQQEWLSWFREPGPLEREFAPELSWMPAGLRRRVSPLGRAALNVLAACQPDEPCPVVFASRYGDLDAIAGLLTQLHREGGVSPMAFSLSVHNSAVGVYSIARKDRVTTTSIAARTDLAEAAFFEALGCLASGIPRVLVVCCEDCIPRPYRVEGKDGGFRYAWACCLRAQSAGGFALMAATSGPVDMCFPSRVDHPSLRALAFLVSDEGASLASESGHYLWRRHA